MAFVDGQNLFYGAKEAFGYPYPNYNVHALAERVCRTRGWTLSEARFYTGVPAASDDVFWNHFWSAKLTQMARTGVHTFSRPLRYRNRSLRLPNGQVQTVLVGQEKGVDIRLALDMVRAVNECLCEVILIFSQDQDLTEVVEEVRFIAGKQGRQVWVASAYPVSPTSLNTRGIDKTEWIKITRADYDACLDPRDYRPKRKS
jgi:uncharacterized LabA/DUF88 family protein